VTAATARPVVFTGDIFRVQERGGITRVFVEVARRLTRPVVVIAGFHISHDLAVLGARVRQGWRRSRFRGDRLVFGPLDRFVETWSLPRSGVILHPTYYRPPRLLPAGVPWVVTVHDMAHERFPDLFRHPWWRPDPAVFKRALCAKAGRIICYSESTRHDLAEFLPEAAARIRAIPLAGRNWNGVPSREVPGVPRPFALWVGERHGYKNWARTMEALSRSSGRTMGVLCAGGGSLDAGEKECLRRVGLEGRTVQHGLSEAELRWAYENAAALLYTALWEGFGLPVLEALALGCPVLASSRASLPEVGGQVVTYADPEDLEALRHGIDRVLAQERTPEGVAARLAQASRFSWDATAVAYEQVYRELD
jgi:glycosyltransferase involved in cell wall biosynthesis